MVDVNSIKDEARRGLKSPQHGSRSVNGTPTSTHSSLLADGPSSGSVEFPGDSIKPAMYGAQIFTSNGSGSASPVSYGDHVTQYTQSVSGSYTTSVSRPGATTAFSVTDPYYREYFTTVASGAGTPEPVYSGQVRQGQLSYGEEATAGTTASFVDRYMRQPGAYGKGVIAVAGLTVDLPSPDSGIGADAITPRDQNTMQQVSPPLNNPRTCLLTKYSLYTYFLADIRLH